MTIRRHHSISALLALLALPAAAADDWYTGYVHSVGLLDTGEVYVQLDPDPAEQGFNCRDGWAIVSSDGEDREDDARIMDRLFDLFSGAIARNAEISAYLEEVTLQDGLTFCQVDRVQVWAVEHPVCNGAPTDPGGSAPDPGDTASNSAPREKSRPHHLYVQPGEYIQFDGRNRFTDNDGDPLVYSGESSDTGIMTVSVSGNVYTVNGVSNGRADLTITATDPSGASASQVTQIRVGESPGDGGGDTVSQTDCDKAWKGDPDDYAQVGVLCAAACSALNAGLDEAAESYCGILTDWARRSGTKRDKECPVCKGL